MSYRGLLLFLRGMAAAIFVFALSGCGVGGDGANLVGSVQAPTHNKLATKVLADIAVGRVRGAMPSKVASRRRGRDTL